MPLGDMIKKRFRPNPTKQSVPTKSDITKLVIENPNTTKPRKRSVPLKDLEEQLKGQLGNYQEEEEDQQFYEHEENEVFHRLGNSDTTNPMMPRSNMSFTLEEMLNSPTSGAITYFVEYLEARDASNLLKFWLDVEGFKASSHYNRQEGNPNRSSSTQLFNRKESNSNSNFVDSRDFESYVSISESYPDSTDVDITDPRTSSIRSTDSFDSGLILNDHFSAVISNKNKNFEDEKKSVISHKDENEQNCEEDKKLNSQMKKNPSSKDALEIYQRYIAPDCPYEVPLNKEIAQNIVQGICTETGDLDTSCFDLAQTYIIKLLEIEYLPDFLQSQGYAKHQLDLVTSGDISMSDILGNDNLLIYFMEFMEGEGDRDLLEFWMAASNFRKNTNKEHLKQDALVIYERFISLQAPSNLGISDKLRLQIEERICKENGVQSNCFNSLLNLVTKILQVKYLNLFLNSKLFKKYLSELLCQIQASNNPAYVKSKHQIRKNSKRSGSNTSLSTNSGTGDISTHNTLLAMSTRNSFSAKNNGNLFCLDALDPDRLWKRKHKSIINIGEVDELGRYWSRFEMLPNKSSRPGSKFSKAVKKLVHNEDITKVQEEMAWQMAEAVISEIMELNRMARKNFVISK